MEWPAAAVLSGLQPRSEVTWAAGMRLLFLVGRRLSKLLSRLVQRGDDPELLEKSQVIWIEPLFDDFAVLDMAYRASRPGHLFAGRRNG